VTLTLAAILCLVPGAGARITGQDARAASLLAVSVTLAFGAALIANRLARVD